ncbi:MAG: 16S rRNA (guanine(966)-N(2))-methyltransferase RsmD [Bdellovibrionota bacterium]
MRIISGKWKSRALKGFEGAKIRPTSDKVRGALFSAVESALGARGKSWEDLSVCDLYAGTGALGLEALSRGAKSAVLVEEDLAAARLIQENVKVFEAEEAASIRKSAVSKYIEKTPAGDGPFDLVFADPPYGKGESGRVLELVSHWARVAPAALLVVERGEKESEPAVPPGFRRIFSRSWGDTAATVDEKLP